MANLMRVNIHLAIWLLGGLFLSSCQLITEKPSPSKHATALIVKPDQPISKKALEANSDNESHSVQTEKSKSYDDVWQRLRERFQLDLDQSHPLVTNDINKFQRHPEYFTKVINRAKPYIYFIAEELEKRDMPAEIAMLPIVESAFDPFAYSHGQASGMWQFIPSTGKEKGLKQNWWYDGRRDVVASTHAALDYLIWLKEFQKDDWLLGLASYNSGPGTVQKAIKRNKKRGIKTDFWHLDLPTETEIYVPRLIALAKIFKEPAKYGISLQPVPNKPYFAQVNTKSQIDLAQAAKLAEIEIEQLYLLNPAFNRCNQP